MGGRSGRWSCLSREEQRGSPESGAVARGLREQGLKLFIRVLGLALQWAAEGMEKGPGRKVS